MVWHEVRIDRNIGATDGETRKIRDCPLGPVCRKDGHAVAGIDSQFPESEADMVHATSEFLMCDIVPLPIGLVAKGGALGVETLDRVEEELGQGLRHRHDCLCSPRLGRAGESCWLACRERGLALLDVDDAPVGVTTVIGMGLERIFSTRACTRPKPGCTPETIPVTVSSVKPICPESTSIIAQKISASATNLPAASTA